MKPLQPLKIGPLLVDPPVVLAPMAGVTNVAFRRLCRSYGGGLYVSEMVSARALVEGNAKTARMVAFGPDEQPRSIQLYGVDPAVVGLAVRRLVDGMGVDHVDLNFGCPAAKVTRKGGGAALPAHPVLFRRIVAAAVDAAGVVPVTVKMRLGVDASHPTAVESAVAAASVGAAAVTVHGRTAEQLYGGTADWAAIARVREAVPADVPVLANGDVWSACDAVALLAATGCDGVVVGRGCLGRPWLFRDLDAVLSGRPVPEPPSLHEVCDVMHEHASLLCALLGSERRGMRDFRKHVGWYFAGYPIGAAARQAVGSLDALADLDSLLASVCDRLPADVVPEPVRRGPVNGPRPVHLPAGWYATADSPDPPAGADVLVSGG